MLWQRKGMRLRVDYYVNKVISTTETIYIFGSHLIFCLRLYNTFENNIVLNILDLLDFIYVLYQKDFLYMCYTSLPNSILYKTFNIRILLKAYRTYFQPFHAHAIICHII